MYTIHATKKLRDRLSGPIEADVEEPSTLLGNWYATAIFWKPQVVLLVNGRTRLPVFMPLAPVNSLRSRFPDHLADVLAALEIPDDFIEHEVRAMDECVYAKTADRSVVGSMTDFTFLAEAGRARGRVEGLGAMSARLAHTPCRPLEKGEGFPDLEVQALASAWSSG